MAIQLRSGGVWRVITSGKVFSAGAWRSLVAGKVYSGGSWRTVFNFTVSGGGGGGGGTISVTTAPSTFSRAGHGVTSLQVTPTATPTGGLAPYHYNWTLVSQTNTSVGLVTIPVNNAATTTIRCAFLNFGTVNCTVRCTVTDALNSSAHADITGTFTDIDPSGP